MNNDLYLKKRKEDIRFAMEHLKKNGFEIHEHFSSKASYYSCCWLLIEVSEENQQLASQFKEKAISFFERNLALKNHSDFIVSFFSSGALEKEKEQNLISILLVSPAAQIFIFSEESQELKEETFGKAKLYWFPPLLKTLKEATLRKKLAARLYRFKTRR